MNRGPKTNEERLEEIREGLKEIDAQIKKIGDSQDKKSQEERTALIRMKELQLNRIKQLEKSITPHSASDIPEIKIAREKEKAESSSESPSGSPRKENLLRHYYESPQAAAHAASSSQSRVSEKDRRHVLGRKMGKAVHEGMELYEESESKASINNAVNNAIEFLATLEEIFQTSLGKSYDMYQHEGPIDLNLQGIQRGGVQASTSGRLFGRTDYFIQAHDDKPKMNGFVDTIKGVRRDGKPYQFESNYHVDMLKEMIASGKITPEHINHFLENVVELIEADSNWTAFWHQRPNTDEGI